MIYFILLLLFSCHSLRAQGLVYYGGIQITTALAFSTMPADSGFYLIDHETGDLSQWDGSRVDAGSIEISTSEVYEGTYSRLLLYDGDRDVRSWYNIDNTHGYPVWDTLSVLWWLYIPSLADTNYFGPSNQSFELSALRSTSASPFWVLELDSVVGGYDLELICFDDAVGTYKDSHLLGSVVLNPDTWVSIQVFITRSSSAVCSVYVADVLKLSVSGFSNIGLNWNQFEAGGDNGNAPDGSWFIYTDYFVFDSTKIVY